MMKIINMIHFQMIFKSNYIQLMYQHELKHLFSPTCDVMYILLTV